MWYALRIVDLAEVELQVAVGNVKGAADERRALRDGSLYSSESGLQVRGHVSTKSWRRWM